MKTNYTPFAYLLDERNGHLCDLAGCGEPAYVNVLFRVDADTDSGESDVDVRLCIPHFNALKRTCAHPHGEGEVTA